MNKAVCVSWWVCRCRCRCVDVCHLSKEKNGTMVGVRRCLQFFVSCCPGFESYYHAFPDLFGLLYWYNYLVNQTVINLSVNCEFWKKYSAVGQKCPFIFNNLFTTFHAGWLAGSLSKLWKVQCDQMAILFFKYLAISNNQNLPKSIKYLPK